ncbi:MAG: MBL fold metallo-hydrolase [Coriobacteriales bacterium]|jgi:phosphoribosyl 1,2-cyclic phosphate phosphodiesterase|nr:MBL fold metallo-hydrolase [Coriobacteriales bacterium]
MTQPAHTLTFLGSGASCGVPSFYCGCKACDEARINPKAARTCSSILISGAQNTLIDTAPEMRLQLIRAGIDRIDQLLLTHEHFDHVGGLPQFEFYTKLKSHEPLPVYLGIETLMAVEQQFAGLLESLETHRIIPWEALDFDGIRYTALPATHSQGAYGFKIQSADKVVAYFPDTGPLQEGTLDFMHKLDILIIDATFNGVNWMPYSHHTIDEAIALAQGLGAKKTYLTHLAMHYDTPLTLTELEHKLATHNGTIEPAWDGLTIEL